MMFGDQLSDRQIFAAIQANGTVKDIGGALQYYNMKNRWNWGAGVEHIPYLTGGVLPRYDASDVERRRFRPVGESVGAADLHRPGNDLHAVPVLDDETTRAVGAAITHYGFDTQIIPHDLRRVAIRSSTRARRPSAVAVQAGVVRRAVGRARRRQLVRGIHVAGARRALSAPVHADRRIGHLSARRRSITGVTSSSRPFTFALRGIVDRPLRKAAPRTRTRRGRSISATRRSFAVTATARSRATSASLAPATTQRRQTGCPVFDRLFGSKVGGRQRRVPHSAVRHGGIRTAELPLPADRSVAVLRRGVSRTPTQQGPDLRLTRVGEHDIRRTARRCRAIRSPTQQQSLLPVRRPHSGVQHRPVVPLQPDGIRDHGSLHRPSVPAPDEELGVGIPAGAGLVRLARHCSNILEREFGKLNELTRI